VLEKFFVSGDKRRVRDMTGSVRERQAARVLTEASLRVMNVDVAARLPSFRVPLRQLLKLPPGTVLHTNIPTDSELEILVGGQPRYRATSGRVGQKLAVRLTDAPDAAIVPSLPG
jgi:flagellar motor switch protein FliM